jgi:hypothetical protein
MINTLRNTAIGVGVGALVVAAATPALALPNLPALGPTTMTHMPTARAYGDPYGGYAYAPVAGSSEISWEIPGLSGQAFEFTRIRPVK